MMKMRYFEDTDTLYIEFNTAAVTEPQDLDENTVMEVDANGAMIALTIEHASSRADIKHLTLASTAAVI